MQKTTEILQLATGPAAVTTVNGVDTIALQDVSTVDGVKPFADGKVVGVFGEEHQDIVTRMGQPEDFITKALQTAGVKHPTAWLAGMNPHYLKEGTPVAEKIYHINQQLRIRVACLVPDSALTIAQRATIVDVLSVEDWYRITSANILTYMAQMEKDLQAGYDAEKAQKEAEEKGNVPAVGFIESVTITRGTDSEPLAATADGVPIRARGERPELQHIDEAAFKGRNLEQFRGTLDLSRGGPIGYSPDLADSAAPSSSDEG